MAKTIQKNKLWLEIAGVLLLALTVLILISLFSYHPADEAANLAGGLRQNLAGVVGAYLSDVLFQSAGPVAYLFPIITLLLSLNCFLSAEKRIKKRKFLGVSLGMVACCAILALYFDHPITLWGVEYRLAGGIVGDMSRKLLLLPYLNTWGAYLIANTLFLIAIMLVTGFSLQTIAVGLGTVSIAIAKGGWKSVRFLFVAVKPKKKTKVKMETRAPSPRTKAKVKKGELKSKTDSERISPEVQQDEPAISSSPPPKITVKKEKEEDVPLHMNIEPMTIGNYKLPDLSLLETPKHISMEDVRKGLLDRSSTIETKLKDFGVNGRIVQVCLGPVITRYEFEPAPGIKINKITNMADDLALALKALSVRIVAPIPGKAVVGIEVPNKKRQVIYLREVFAADCFQNAASSLTLALGKDTEGNPCVTNLAGMPHLLIAGATGSGKSVALNTIVCSILYKASPADVRFVMVDPKMLELGIYNGIPHLLGPVVTNPKKAAAVLQWAVREMEERYQTLSEVGVRNIDQYNQYVKKYKPQFDEDGLEKEAPTHLPYIVILIDEFADLMLMAAKDIEGLITRLAQMARAVGIHLIVATQRPSVDVITGIIKANFPCRISFRVASKIDSRTILDSNGAEKLLGKGDMLFVPPHTSIQERVHGAMVSEKEVKAIVDFLKQQTESAEKGWQPSEDYEAMVLREDDPESEGFEEEYDEFYDQAVDIVIKTGQASISMVQRRLRIGYNRAARMVEVMEKDGIVGPAIAGKPREVLVKEEGGVK